MAEPIPESDWFKSVPDKRATFTKKKDELNAVIAHENALIVERNAVLDAREVDLSTREERVAAKEAHLERAAVEASQVEFVDLPVLPVRDDPDGEFTLPGQRRATTKARAAGVMLVSGSSPDYIAEVVGFSTGAVAKQSALKALAESLDRSDKDAIKDVLGARLEALFRSTFKRSQDPRYPAREVATGQALKIIEAQMKLFGVAAPTTVMVGSATDAQINDFVARVAESRIKSLPQEKDVIRGELGS